MHTFYTFYSDMSRSTTTACCRCYASQLGLISSSEGWGDAFPEALGRRSLLCTPATPWQWWHTPLPAVWRRGKELAANTHSHELSHIKMCSWHHADHAFNVVYLVFMLYVCFFNLWCVTENEVKINIMQVWIFSNKSRYSNKSQISNNDRGVWSTWTNKGRGKSKGG